MATIIRMPEVSANSTHAVLQSWLKSKGDKVARGEPIAEIETDKATVEINAEADGVIGRLIVGNGQEAEVGSPIGLIIAEGETLDVDANVASSDDKLVAVGSDQPREPDLPATPAEPASNGAQAVRDGRAFASPLARRLAEDHGVALDAVKGSGPYGRVVKLDVLQAIEQSAAVSAAVPATSSRPRAVESIASVTGDGEYTEIAHSGMRRAIARRLTESKSNVPHFYLTATCRVDALMALREQLNNGRSRKISVNDIFVKAIATALSEVPAMNVIWTETAMRHFSHPNIAVAVTTPGGLMTPVVRGVDSLSLGALSSRIAELAGRARDGKLKQDELEGGTFAISNLGMFGTEEFAAILNPPQSAILAVGAAMDGPIVVDGALTVGRTVKVTLSVDHRAIDGVLAAEWLAAFACLIHNPLRIMA
jgi:pyruvate dehydrogenase E2 component (dihydrolipoamide acetyltransferase)